MSEVPPAQIFSDQQWQSLLPVLENLNEPQRFWLSGYLAAMSSKPDVKVTGQQVAEPLTIAYGTETDNCKHLAQELGKLCDEQGIGAQVVDLGQLRIRRLPRLKHFIVITATHGDGDPPEPVADFFDALMSDEAPRVEEMKFAVLALGDSSYELFCVTGQAIDQRLEELGGTRLIPRRDCDVDFQKPAREWMEQLLPTLPRTNSGTTAAADANFSIPATTTTEYSKSHPLTVEVLDNRCLSHPDRARPVNHIELELADAVLPLEPGDAVGVLPDNPPELVARILDLTGTSGDAPVLVDDNAMPLVEALRSYRDLTIAARGFLPFWASLADSPELTAVVDADAPVQRAYLKDHQVTDIMRQAPARPDPQQLVDNLRPLQPRLYDLANCLQELDDELHLTVQDYRYTFGTREETGIASQYLLSLQPGDTLRVYPHRNARFHLPDEPDVPVILIGEGTGIAPYRAFLQRLRTTQPERKCWMVFSETSFEDDFLYQLDLQQAINEGILDELDTVFYQQQPGRHLADPLVENIDRLTAWLNENAHIYLCGDKDVLAKCEATLEQKLDELQSKGFWKQLSKSKRVHRNVY